MCDTMCLGNAMHITASVAITDGQLHLGPLEHIFYYEFDGRRLKRILAKMIGE
nr:YjbQ family protein [Gimesia chilikensis]